MQASNNPSLSIPGDKENLLRAATAFAYIAGVSHFLLQDPGGFLASIAAAAASTNLLVQRKQSSTLTTLTCWMVFLLMSCIVDLSILASTSGKLWLADFSTRMTFTLYLLDIAICSLAAIILRSASAFNTGIFSNFNYWSTYGLAQATTPQGTWTPFIGEPTKLEP